MVLAGGPQASQFREDDGLANLQFLFHRRQVFHQDAGGGSPVHLIGRGIQVYQQGITPLPGREIEAAVRRMDGIAFVGEHRRHQIGHKTAYAGKGHGVVVENQFPNHLGEEVDIHTASPVGMFTQRYEKKGKIICSFQKMHYLCNPVR